MKKVKLVSFIPLMALMMFVAGATVQAQSIERVMTLEKLFQLADSVNLAIKSAEGSARVADAAVKVSKNGLLPDINFSASATYNGDAWMADRNFSHGRNLDSPHFGNNFALEVVQMVYAGGAIKHGIERAELQAHLASLDVSNQRQKVRFLITGYYLNLYKFRNMQGVYNRNIERTEQVIKDMRAREEQGLTLANDITRYEVQLQNLIYKRTELMSQIDIFNNRLVTTLSLSDGTQIMPDTTLLHLSMREYTENDLWGIADEHSPLLQMSRTNIDISRKQEKIERAGMLPKISVFAGDRLQGPLTMELPPVDKNLNTWYVGVGLSFNFGNLYKSQRDVNRSRLAISEAQTRYAETEENIGLEIHQAYVDYHNAFELLRTQEKSLQLASENYAVTENRYNNDLVLLIDLLDADNIKLDAEIQYVNARINIIYNYYRLMYVTGTL